MVVLPACLSLHTGNETSKCRLAALQNSRPEALRYWGNDGLSFQQEARGAAMPDRRWLLTPPVFIILY